MSTIAWWYWGCIWTAKLWISSSPSVRKSKGTCLWQNNSYLCTFYKQTFYQKTKHIFAAPNIKNTLRTFLFLFNDLIDLLTSIFLWKPRGHEGHFKSIRKRVESVKWLRVNRSHDGKSPSVRSGVGCYSTELKSFR